MSAALSFPPAPLMTASPGGAVRSMLPIAQRLNALPLKHAARAVLIEVCELAERGIRQRFDATNQHLAQAIGGTACERTAKRAVAELVTRALLLSSGNTRQRVLLPTEQVRACYTGSEAEQTAACEALSAVLIRDKNAPDSGQPVPNVSRIIRDKTGHDSGQNGPVIRDIPGRIRDNSGRAYKEDFQDLQVTTSNQQEVARLSAALADAEKKAADLQAELDALKAEKATAPPVAPPPSPAPPPTPAKPRRRVAHGEAEPEFDALKDSDTLPTWPTWAGEAFREAWLKFVEMRLDPAASRRKNRKAEYSRRAAEQALRELAEFDEPFAVAALQKATGGEWAGVVQDSTTAAWERRQQSARPAAAGHAAPSAAHQIGGGYGRPNAQIVGAATDALLDLYFANQPE